MKCFYNEVYHYLNTGLTKIRKVGFKLTLPQVDSFIELSEVNV